MLQRALKRLISRVFKRRIDWHQGQRLGKYEDLVPERPGRRDPRAVKRRPKPYPRLNQPRHLIREDGQLSYCKQLI